MRLYELLSKIWFSSYTLEHISNQYILWKQAKKRKSCNLILDILLGPIFCIILTYCSSTQDVTNFILMRITNVEDLIEELLVWLMGVPAGLKLNHELSSFLGNFFIYHVYIWIGYLMLIEPYLTSIVTLMMYSSCLGFTLLLSLSNDLINLLTFHVYCFYVYAAKLYNFQLQGLQSLARLFMGKKWNVLRSRVDSAKYSADQLILGTILFTILLFLLPTLMLYYVVFATTRMLILIIQCIFYSAVHMITQFPVYEIIVRMRVKEHPQDETVKESDSTREGIRLQSVSYMSIITNSVDLSIPNFLEIFKKLLIGKIIKPWNE